jgi:hypothetical protein
MSQFMGWWRSFFLQATDAPAVFGEASGIQVLSTLALGHRWVDVAQGITPNLYMLVTGDSSVARKSTSVRFARQAIEEINEARVGPKDYTMEGLYKWMQVKDPNTGKGRSTVGLFSEEWGTDLSRSEAYGGTMREDLCGLYDGDDFSKVRAKSDSITILRPRVNLMGGVAYNLLTEYCSKHDWFTGFFMRFIFVAPVEMRQKTTIQPKFPTALWNYAITQLANLHDFIKSNPYGLPLSPQAVKHYSDFLNSIPVVDDDAGVAPIYVQRLGPNILKLALLYQIDRDPTAPIGIDAMNDACNFVAYCLWPSFQTVYKVTTKNEFSTALAQVVEWARRPQGATRAEIYRGFSDRLGLPAQLMQFVKRSAAFSKGFDLNGDETWKLLKW